jgi:hypothetical protein
VGQGLTLLAVTGIDDLDVGTGVSGHELFTADLVDDDDVGLREVLRGPEGQQAGVTRTGTDEGDAAGLAGSLR